MAGVEWGLNVLLTMEFIEVVEEVEVEGPLDVVVKLFLWTIVLVGIGLSLELVWPEKKEKEILLIICNVYFFRENNELLLELRAD